MVDISNKWTLVSGASGVVRDIISVENYFFGLRTMSDWIEVGLGKLKSY